jgi:hypothetical protein
MKACRYRPHHPVDHADANDNAVSQDGLSPVGWAPAPPPPRALKCLYFAASRFAITAGANGLRISKHESMTPLRRGRPRFVAPFTIEVARHDVAQSAGSSQQNTPVLRSNRYAPLICLLRLPVKWHPRCCVCHPLFRNKGVSCEVQQLLRRIFVFPERQKATALRHCIVCECRVLIGVLRSCAKIPQQHVNKWYFRVLP